MIINTRTLIILIITQITLLVYACVVNLEPSVWLFIPMILGILLIMVSKIMGFIMMVNIVKKSSKSDISLDDIKSLKEMIKK